MSIKVERVISDDESGYEGDFVAEVLPHCEDDLEENEAYTHGLVIDGTVVALTRRIDLS